MGAGVKYKINYKFNLIFKGKRMLGSYIKD